MDDPATAKLPEIAITGHWHTYADTVWQPVALHHKTIFTEAASFNHYVGELRVDPAGKYVSNANYVLRNATITPDPDSLIQSLKDQFNATNPPYTTDQVIGYTADDLLLDNYMKWWSADEFPWSGNNTAGNWICDGIQWKATALFGQCDLSVESGGGVRSDIPGRPGDLHGDLRDLSLGDDTIYVVNMTGQQIWNYIQHDGCDVALSHGWFVTAYDGNPTAITYNGQPIGMTTTYKVAITNYMYLHDSVPLHRSESPDFQLSGAHGPGGIHRPISAGKSLSCRSFALLAQYRLFRGLSRGGDDDERQRHRAGIRRRVHPLAERQR
ncbi:MAG: 5'-nucleotidase C-terminal domain-containing protein [Chthoniobacter sp.]